MARKKTSEETAETENTGMAGAPVWQSIRKVFSCPKIDAKAGNVRITSDWHGQGFELFIDGEPVKMLRAVTLRLAIDELNTVTVEFMPEFKQ